MAYIQCKLIPKKKFFNASIGESATSHDKYLIDTEDGYIRFISGDIIRLLFDVEEKDR